jgi:hypothetical protein
VYNDIEYFLGIEYIFMTSLQEIRLMPTATRSYYAITLKQSQFALELNIFQAAIAYLPIFANRLQKIGSSNE